MQPFNMFKIWVSEDSSIKNLFPAGQFVVILG